MPCYVKDLISTATAEIGYHEKKTNAYINDKTANVGSNNYNKYAAYIDSNFPNFYNTKKNGYAWCDIYVDFCFIHAYGLDNAKRLLNQPDHSLGAGCRYSYQYFKQAGRVGKTPKVGAQVFFGKSESTLVHTGIVEAFDDKYVYTIEGNTSDIVARRKYTRTGSGSNIFGYGYPPYDIEPDAVTGATSVMGKKIQWYGRVTCDDLNVRTWAGTENSQLKSVPVIHKNDVVGICGSEKDNRGANWYYVVINNKVFGFVHSDYIARINAGVVTTNDPMPENGIIPEQNLAVNQTNKIV